MTTYTYNHNDRLLTETPLPGGAGGGFTSTYDNNGNMLSKAGNGEQMNLTYNALNQLVHADMTTTTGSTTVDYAYDHDGIRVGKTINGTDVFTYVVDKNRPYAQVLEEQRTQGALSATTHYVYGDDLLSRTTDGVTHYYQYDGLGSTRALSDASGTITDTYQYDAYGLLLNSTGASVNSYLYRGEQYDPALSAYYLRARYYQPGMGRFLTTDLLEGGPNNPITLHRYAYGNDDPIRYIDPSGKVSLPELLIGGGIIMNLSAMALSYYDLGEFFLAELARNVYPEAYIVGVNFIGTVPLIGTWIQEVFEDFPYPYNFPDPFNTNVHDNRFVSNATVAVGFELLFSLGSGEIGVFKTTMLGQTFSFPTASVGIEAYDGPVFNLWDVNDYTGPFGAAGFSIGSFSLSVFWDGLRTLGGPWGLTSTFASKSFGVSWPISFSKANIDYARVGKMEIDRAALSIMIIKILSWKTAIRSIVNSNPFAISLMFLEATTWATIARAHQAWDRVEPRFSMKKRRKKDRDLTYQSGPYNWLFSK